MGAAVPRAAAHRRRCATRAAELAVDAPRARRRPRPARRGHRGRGHGVARAGAGRRDGAAARPAAGRDPRRRVRPGAGPHPGARPGRDQRRSSSTASWADAAAGAATPLDLGAAAYRSLADVREPGRSSSACRGGRSRPFAADEEDESRRRPRSCGARAVEGYRGDTARAVADVKGWLGDGWRVVLADRGARPGAAARSRCSAARTSRPGWTTSLDEAPDAGAGARDAVPASHAASSATSCGSSCSPRPT